MFRCTQCGAFNRVPERRPEGNATCGRCGASLDLSGHPQNMDDAALTRALGASPVPVLVDFWAPWCAPCVMAAPLVDQVAQSLAGEALVLKVDTERHPSAGPRHGVRSIPTFALFSGGTERARQIGMLPKGQFREWVARHLVAAQAAPGAPTAGAGTGAARPSPSPPGR